MAGLRYQADCEGPSARGEVRCRTASSSGRPATSASARWRRRSAIPTSRSWASACTAPTRSASTPATIAGTDTVTGVLATDDVDALVALDADCVLYMPSRLDLDELCRLLASGKNVVSTCSELLWARRALPADQVEQLEQACAQGDVSLFATGSSPGFISEVVPIALLLLERRVDRIVIEEFANMSQRPSPQLLFEVMGFGREPGPVDERRAHHMRLQLRTAARGARRTRRHPDRPRRGPRRGRGDDSATSPSPPVRSARASVAAQRTIVAAMDGDRERLVFQATWYCSTELDHDWHARRDRLAGDGRGRRAAQGRHRVPGGDGRPRVGDARASPRIPR